jgi:hypothetical protein
MKIRKLWCALLTMVLVVAMSMPSYCASGDLIGTIKETYDVYYRLTSNSSDNSTYKLYIYGENGYEYCEYNIAKLQTLNANFNKNKITVLQVAEEMSGMTEGMMAGSTSLQTVYLPSTLSYVENSAFSGCTNLSNIYYYGVNLSSIGDSAFENCSSLKNISIRSARSIGSYAFKGCTGLTSIFIPKATTIGTGAFQNCTGLTSIIIPPNVTSIGTGAFQGCTNLKNVTVYTKTGATPISLTNSGLSSDATITYKTVDGFCGDSSVYTLSTNSDGTDTMNISGTGYINPDFYVWDYYTRSNTSVVIINDGISGAEEEAFKGFTKLKKVNILSKDFYGNNQIFADCTNLTDVSLVDGITDIAYEMFLGCTGLKNITLPSTLTYIDDFAFQDCSGLTSISIPEGVSYIGYDSFSGCTSLENMVIYYKQSKPDLSDADVDESKVTYKKITDGATVDATSELSNDNLLNVKINSNMFGGDPASGSKYLFGVNVIINDVEYGLTSCYKDEDNEDIIVFPIKLTVENDSISNVSIRAEACTKDSEDSEDVSYFASVASGMSR